MKVLQTVLVLIVALIAVGCQSAIIQPKPNDITTRCMSAKSGIITSGPYQTEGCSTHLPDDIREAVIKGKMVINYSCENGDCSIEIKSK